MIQKYVTVCTNYHLFGILSVKTIIKICQVTVELFLFMGHRQCLMIVKILLVHGDAFSWVIGLLHYNVLRHYFDKLLQGLMVTHQIHEH